jgi:hypothetical protein
MMGRSTGTGSCSKVGAVSTPFLVSSLKVFCIMSKTSEHGFEPLALYSSLRRRRLASLPISPSYLLFDAQDDTLFKFVGTVVFKILYLATTTALSTRNVLCSLLGYTTQSPSANAIESLPSMCVLVGSVLGGYISLCETSCVAVYPCMKRPG